jgi:hypothetical protein
MHKAAARGSRSPLGTASLVLIEEWKHPNKRLFEILFVDWRDSLIGIKAEVTHEQRSIPPRGRPLVGLPKSNRPMFDAQFQAQLLHGQVLFEPFCSHMVGNANRLQMSV